MTDIHNRPYIIAWAAIAIFSQMFLVGISATGASFDSSGQPYRDYFAPSQLISSRFDNDLTIIADNLKWSVNTTSNIVGTKIAGFLGIDQNYAFDQNYSDQFASQADLSPMVLGAHTSSP